MRVLCVGNMYPPHHLGGYELAWQSAVEHLRRRDHHVRVLTSDHRQPGVERADDDRDVHRELRWYWRDYGFPRMSPLARLRLERANAEVFDGHLADFAPDVAAWWSMGMMSLSLVGRCARAGIPSAGFVHDDWLAYGPRGDAWTRMFRRLGPVASVAAAATGIPTRFQPGSVDRWQFVSEAIRSRALDAHARLGETEVSPTGIEERFLTGANGHEWSWRLLYAGRIDARKGIDTAIAALAQMPDAATLTIAGGGDPRVTRALSEQIAALALQQRVTMTGAVPRARLVELYAGADALLFPVRWVEPWGLVPLEAMGGGAPVVATGLGGSGEYLADERNCLLVAPDDPAALATAVSRLAADPALRERLRRGGRETAARFTEDRYNEGVERALAAVAGATTAPAPAAAPAPARTDGRD